MHALQTGGGGMIGVAMRAGIPPRRIELGAISHPAREYTGDFYYAHRDRSGRQWFIVGDVSGKGIGAAIYMAMLLEAIEPAVRCADRDYTPLELVQELDAMLRAEVPENRFATMIAATLDDRGALEVVNAGHLPLLVVSPSGTVDCVSSTGPVIGIHPWPSWHAVRRHVSPGMSIVAFSDGVLEATGSDGDEFGLARIIGTVAPLAGRAPEEITQALRDAVCAHTGGAQQDDLTVLALRPGGEEHRVSQSEGVYRRYRYRLS
ncbi:MAG: PP2C family protein-serine/threonine phosphatase [Thermoanaerobaculia bacterium]